MEIIIVTGTNSNAAKIEERCKALMHDGYSEIENPAYRDAHPIDIAKRVEEVVKNLAKDYPDGKFFIRTNSEIVIYELRILVREKVIKTLKCLDFSCNGLEFIIDCNDKGHWSNPPPHFMNTYMLLCLKLIS